MKRRHRKSVIEGSSSSDDDDDDAFSAFTSKRRMKKKNATNPKESTTKTKAKEESTTNHNSSHNNNSSVVDTSSNKRHHHITSERQAKMDALLQELEESQTTISTISTNRPPPDKRGSFVEPGEEHLTTNVFVGNLAPSVTEEQLTEAFRQFGETNQKHTNTNYHYFFSLSLENHYDVNETMMNLYIVAKYWKYLLQHCLVHFFMCDPIPKYVIKM